MSAVQTVIRSNLEDISTSRYFFLSPLPVLTIFLLVLSSIVLINQPPEA